MKGRCFAVLVLLGTLVSLAQAQNGFGRFGFTSAPSVAGFTVSRSGLKNHFGGSDAILFANEQKKWTPLLTSPFRQVIGCDGTVGSPSKVRLDVFDYGVSMYFPNGIELKVRSTATPILTWTAGSVKNGVPTAAADWLAISYQDQQPPVVLGFPEERANLQIDGELGNWTIKSSPKFKGWVRFSLPYGLQPVQAISASGLGKIAKRCKEEETLWYAPIGDTPEPSVEEDADGITLNYRFPRKRSVIPAMFYLADAGGYPARILTDFKFYPELIDDGPVLLTDEAKLSVRLPVRRIPSGRGLSIGEPIPQSYPDASWDNPLKVIDLGLANTLSGRSRELSEKARILLNSYFENVQTSREPTTNQMVFYDADGKGMLQTAVHSLLGQSVRTGESGDGAEDPQLTSLLWRLDPYAGGLGTSHSDERRVKAIAAIAGAFSSKPKMRYAAAMFQCALSAERGKAIYLKRRFLPFGNGEFVEPMLGVRKALFALTQDSIVDPVLTNWQSEVRCYGDTPVWLQNEGNSLQLIWNVRDKLLGTIRLESAYKIFMSSRTNIQSIIVDNQIGSQEIKYQPMQIEQCSMHLFVPEWAKPFPMTVLPPTYFESKSQL